MSDSLFSTYWYRVSGLRPVLRDAARISRHLYRGQVWYVIRNQLTNRNHRFNAAAFRLISQMNGKRTMEEIWEDAKRLMADEPPSQDELIRLLGQLHDADLIQNDILPSTLALLDQAWGRQPRTRGRKAANPFFLRFRLWDPDPFLERWSFLAAPFLTRGMLVLWLLTVSTAAILAVQHWSELSDRLPQQLLTPVGLLTIWLVYPLIKILHEFGHAFAVKKWGGEVHEMGIVLLAFTPIPYVEVSSSGSFPDKRQRIAVAAMGMAVEMLLASLALFVWLNAEPGLVSSLAGQVMLIGGASTLLFNGNPLLRYDGYYILADLVEIPNLKQRSFRYLGYLVQKYLFAIPTASTPVTAPGERIWFLIYGPLALVYRLVVFSGLVLWIGSRYLGLGIIIALWGVVGLFLSPIFRTLGRFLDSPATRRQRPRIAAVTGGAAALIALLMFALPMPLWTTAQGVVWLPERSAVRCGADCELVAVLAQPGQPVAENAPLLRGEDPFLQAETALLEARLQQRSAEYHGQPLTERVNRKILHEEIKRLKADLDQVREDRERLLIRSPGRGNFVLVDERNLPGRFVRQGELLGYIVGSHRPGIRAVVRQADIGLVRERTRSVEIRLAEQFSAPFQATIERIVPAAGIYLPSPALGTRGGGEIPVDPADPEGLRALDTFFQLDLSLPNEIADPHIGGRVYVKFNLGTMPLAFQWYRSLRQLFLRKFYV